MTSAANRLGTPAIRTPRRRTVDNARQEQLLSDISEIFFREGFTSVGVDDLSQRLRCSKATLYAIAGSKEQLVLRITKRFFASSASKIEQVIADEPDSRKLIQRYLEGVGEAMESMSPRFYEDMVSYQPTADVYSDNAATAAKRVREFIAVGVKDGYFRQVHGVFAAQLVALAIEGIHSGQLLKGTDMSAGQAFSELGDLILNGLQSAD
jgi:AcrR family transcriptional regulator